MIYLTTQHITETSELINLVNLTETSNEYRESPAIVLFTG